MGGGIVTNEYFQKSINKYGYKNFKISILHHDIIIEQELSN